MNNMNANGEDVGDHHLGGELEEKSFIHKKNNQICGQIYIAIKDSGIGIAKEN